MVGAGGDGECRGRWRVPGEMVGVGGDGGCRGRWWVYVGRGWILGSSHQPFSSLSCDTCHVTHSNVKLLMKVMRHG